MSKRLEDEINVRKELQIKVAILEHNSIHQNTKVGKPKVFIHF